MTLEAGPSTQDPEPITLEWGSCSSSGCSWISCGTALTGGVMYTTHQLHDIASSHCPSAMPQAAR